MVIIIKVKVEMREGVVEIIVHCVSVSSGKQWGTCGYFLALPHDAQRVFILFLSYISEHCLCMPISSA